LEVVLEIGSDIVEVGWMRRMIARGRQHLETLFTEREIAYCESKMRKAEHYAARFAAKGAVLQALGAGQGSIAFCDMEVVDDAPGKPHLVLHGKARELVEHRQVMQATLSLSHCRENAIAVVVLER
jgi:holo-[acyl-carrier protein] synthase